MVNSASYVLLLAIQDVNKGWVFSHCVGWKTFKSKGFRRYYFFWNRAYILLLFSGFSIFLNSFRKKLSIFFCSFDTSFQRFLYDYVHVFVSVYFLQTSIISVRAQRGYIQWKMIYFFERLVHSKTKHLLLSHISLIKNFLVLKSNTSIK